MELCVTGWSFPLLSLEEAAGVGAALGFTAMDWGAFPGGQLDRAVLLSEPKRLLKRLRETDMLASNLYWTFGAGFKERALNNPDRDERLRNVEDFRRVIDFCGEAGIPSVMLLPGVLHSGQTQAEALATCIEGCNELLQVSGPAGIAIALEPHVMGLLETPEAVLQVVREAEGVRLALDYGHFLTLGYRQADVDPLAPYAAHVHLRQAKPGFLQTRLEHGTLNFPRILNTLRDAGYDGYLAIECVHQDYLQTDNVDVISETVKLRDLLRAHV
jgi:sugar phosphate isomerase/epimerase